MQDPFAWSIPFGQVRGITIRIHILFPFVALALVLRHAFAKESASGVWIDAALVLFWLFLSVLLHEFGHCFGARMVNGEAREVLLWPLGGLARVEVPHTPRANLLMVLAGPAVNVTLAVAAAVTLWLVAGVMPRWDPTGFLARDSRGLLNLPLWGGATQDFSPYSLAVQLTHLFWVNWILALLNLLLVGFPMDAGRMFQCIAWKYVGYRRGTLAAIYAGFVTMFIVGVYSIIDKDPLFLCLALFIYVSCKQEWMMLEGGNEDSLFGYDFSQGYTSLEKDEQQQQPAPPPKPKLSWWQRWKQRRAERKAKAEAEQRESEERRLDELLQKVQREGMNALTDEERRFMKRVSDRYRNRRP